MDGRGHQRNSLTRRQIDARSAYAFMLSDRLRDLPGIAPSEYMEFLLNQDLRVPFVESVATQGTGVYECLNRACKMVMAQFIEQHNMAMADA